MGLRSWVSGLLDDGSGGNSTEDGQLELDVDVERRAGAIVEQYGLAAEDARRLAEILAGELTREDGYTRRMIADRVARETDVDGDQARTVVDTEVASIRNLARVRKFTRQSGETVRFRWIDSVGADESPVCADVRAAIDEAGAVTLDELEDIIEEAASDHEEGTPERADDLIPHEQCRHTVVRHMDG